MAYNAPHFPLAAPEEDVKLFKGKFHDGWDKIRKQIYDRQLKMNLFGKDYPLSKRSPLIPLWENVNATQQMKCEMTMEVYAAMIYHVDKCVGEMVAKLKDKGLYENTVILFLSDNGASAEGGTVFGAKEAQLGDKVKAAGMLGQVWAEMSNTPFALYKHNTHEGGISTPFIVSYPSGIPKNQNGKIVHQYGHVVDIMATIVGICGAKYPTNYNGNEIIPMQGINLLPVLKGEKVKRKEPIVWEHTGNIALRDGKWKIVKERQDTEFELYDMENDRTEMNNLALKKPEILMEMKKKMEAKSQSVGIMAIDFGEIPRWYVPVTKY
jgi:arylsulfatase